MQKGHVDISCDTLHFHDEKKLKKRNDKINSLIKENNDLIEQLKAKEKMKKNKENPTPRLIKVIRGNGNKSNKNNKFIINFSDNN